MFQIVKRNPRAAVIAVLMHLVIIAFLIVGVDWLEKPKQPKSGVEVIQARIVDREELKALNKEEAKLAEQKRLAELEKKRKTQEQERIRKQKQQEAERVEAEAKKRLAQEKKRKAAAKKKRREEKARKLAVEKKRKAKEAKRLAAEKKRKEAEARARRAAAEKVRKEAEAKRRAEEQRRREIEAQRQAEIDAAQRQAEIDARETDRYLVQIQQKINRSWVRPSGIGEGLSCRLRVRLAPGGTVIAVSVLESSGSGAFDRSASNAVLKADPLPVPGGGLFEKFRDINFVFKPNR